VTWKRELEKEGRTNLVYTDDGYPPRIYQIHIYPEISSELINIVCSVSDEFPPKMERYRVLAYYFAPTDRNVECEYVQIASMYHRASILNQRQALQKYLLTYAEEAQKWAEDQFLSPTALLARALS
jgi:hypothetical protein